MGGMKQKQLGRKGGTPGTKRVVWASGRQSHLVSGVQTKTLQLCFSVYYLV